MNPMAEKGQTDKSFGDCKKLDVSSSSCQCVCHSRANLSTSATTADKSAAVDLTVSPCKDSVPPPSEAAGPSRWSLAAAKGFVGWANV